MGAADAPGATVRQRSRMPTLNVRIRRFWLPEPEPDQPLTEPEREGVPATAVAETSRLVEGFVGESFDTEARERSR